MREDWLERDSVRLHYLEWPAAEAQEPAVLLLHGLSSNAHYWERVAARLPGRRLVALDQRSHGLSDRPAGANGMGELVADAAHAITDLGLGRPVVAGHSWGAAVALDLAATRSDLVGGLVFIDGPGSPLSELLTWDQAAQMMQPPLPRYASLKEAAAEARRDLAEAWGADLMEFVRAKLTPDGDALVLTLGEAVRLEMLKGIYAFQPGLLWPQVAGPVTAIWARSAPAPILSWKEAAAELLRSLVPDAAIRWYESPHDVPLHRPAEVAADIEGLCERA